MRAVHRRLCWVGVPVGVHDLRPGEVTYPWLRASIVRRKKRNKRSEATGELEEGPDVLHFAHDPHRLLAFDRRGAHRCPGAPLARLK